MNGGASLFQALDARTSRPDLSACAAAVCLQALAEAAVYAGFGRHLELGVRA